MYIETKLASLGIELADVKPAPGGMYVPAVRTGDLIFVSGQIPVKDGSLITGKVGEALTTEEGQAAARQCAINALAVLKAELGDLDAVVRIVKLQGYVASKDGYAEQHLVINGASQLMNEVFGEAGVHARVAVGVNQLPLDAAVEVELIAQVQDPSSDL